MKYYRVILVIGIIEILIGSITLFSNFASLILETNKKPLNVLIFVILAAITSSVIGIGILRFKKIAYELLLLFSFAVLFSKVLIFMGVVSLHGALETSIPSYVKNGLSIFYHAFVIYYLRQKEIKRIFHIA